MALIRKIYLYLFSLVGLVLVVIGCVQLVDLTLKAYVFTAADQYYAYPVTLPAPVDKNSTTTNCEKTFSESSGTCAIVAQTSNVTPSDAQMKTYQDVQTRSNRERTASNALAMIIVGIPLYYYHWRIIKKDKEEK